MKLSDLTIPQQTALDEMARCGGRPDTIDFVRAGAALSSLARKEILYKVESKLSRKNSFEYRLSHDLCQQWLEARKLIPYTTHERRYRAICRLTYQGQQSLRSVLYGDVCCGHVWSYRRALAMRDLVSIGQRTLRATESTLAAFEQWDSEPKLPPEPINPVGAVDKPVTIVVPSIREDERPRIEELNLTDLARRLKNAPGLSELDKDRMFARERGLVA